MTMPLISKVQPCVGPPLVYEALVIGTHYVNTIRPCINQWMDQSINQWTDRPISLSLKFCHSNFVTYRDAAI